MIRSAIAGNEVLADYPQRQTIFVAIGLTITLVTALIDYHYWASLSRFMYWFAFIALGIIYVYGEARFGSARWVDTGLILIQPSELAKIIVIIVLADYFSRTMNENHDFRWMVGSLALTLGIVVWIILQPNLSTSIVMIVLWAAMLWVSGLPVKYIGLFVIGGIILAAGFFPFMEDYQKQRVANFLFPDPNARHGDTYNVDQALITIGSGGFFGMGYGHGSQVQLRFLKVRHTDFIFSAIAEEFGFVGTLLVMAVLVFVIVRCIRVAQQADDQFGALIAYGIAVLIAFQTAVNIGVNLNLMPVTGLTLPFVSYGGSSLSSLVLGIGLVESVAMRQKPLDF